MTDQNGAENPDATPTEAIELADQQPIAPDAASPEATPASPAQKPEKSGGRHTRTILEIVGAAAAVVLIAAAAAGGFAAGLAVGDDGPRGFDVEHMAEEWQGGGGAGRGDLGRGDMGRGEMGRGHSDGQGFGQGHGEMGEGLGQGFGDEQMREQMDEMLRDLMGDFDQAPGPMQQG